MAERALPSSATTGFGGFGSFLGGGAGAGAIGGGAGFLGTGIATGAALASVGILLAGVGAAGLVLNSLLSERTISETTGLRVGEDGSVSGDTTTVTRRGDISAAFNGRFRTNVEALDDEVTNVFVPVLERIGENVNAQAMVLGGVVTSYAANLTNVDINDIRAVGTAYADTLALTIEGFEGIVPAGQSASGVLTMLVNDVNRFNGALMATGISVLDFTPRLASFNSTILAALDAATGENRSDDGNVDSR